MSASTHTYASTNASTSTELMNSMNTTNMMTTGTGGGEVLMVMADGMRADDDGWFVSNM